VAAPKVVSAKCPTCGANLPVPPGVHQVTCRYCQNVIHIEHRKPPPNVQPFGMPGYMPSTTLYVDPDAAKAGKAVGLIILFTALLPVLIPIFIFVVPLVAKGVKSSVKPFPASCSLNEEIQLSGNYEGTGPLITEVGHNCKIHIKNAKLKGSTLLKTSASNITLTLDNVTIETTDPMVKAGSNLKVKVHKSTLTSAATVFDSDSNIEIEELESSTIESKGGVAIKGRYNLKINAEDAKIRGKKAAIDAESNLTISMKKTSEITSSDGPAIKTSSGFKLEASGGKIDGADGAIIGSSSMSITATGLTISSKEAALKVSSGLKLDFSDGSITSSTEAAIDGDSGMDIELANAKITGADVAIKTSSGFRLKAEKKTQIVSTSGIALVTSSNPDVTLEDSSLEGARAFKGTVNCKLKLQRGSRVAGKKGAIETEGNLQLDGTGAAIDGGSGPGLVTGYNARISFKQGTIKGTPAIQAERKPANLELDGTSVVGEQKIPAR
jgi:hypothetical protein